ncbi:hypothetical protein EJ08DRAFT_696612 [Tothia fuscella]|uniref:Uncharacterized protein n=1 Tax=Tothia fuscella TaxID=1048955 RepID=A0A9P4TYA1_9PEZI|nr:hypothetical protein EJ08DRAFT_696612 [Tothia fuscella]
MPVLEYFNQKKGELERKLSHRHDKEPKRPLLTEEDENFLSKITSEDQAPPLPDRPVTTTDNNGKKVQGKDAQTALMDGADGVPLPNSPAVEGELKEGKIEEDKKKRDYWSYIPKVPTMTFSKGKGKEAAGSDLQAAADQQKTGESIESSEAKSEQDELSSVLDQLNLSAVNNRAFSFSKESTKLMEEFTLILKDLVNGVPTAYDDLEKLLTRQESQLNKMYGAMPPFLQVLVKSLPAKMTGGMGPEFLAAMAEKPGHDAKMAEAQSSGSQTKSKKSYVPSLKSLVSQQGAVAAMLRSILNFLKFRFPVVMTGTNILMSLAVFILLFVFWYCHKRGKETRLAKDGETVDASDSDLEASEVLEKGGNDTEPPITLGNVPAIEEKPSAAVEDLSAILNQSAPSQVPLPQGEERELATPVGAKK